MVNAAVTVTPQPVMEPATGTYIDWFIPLIAFILIIVFAVGVYLVIDRHEKKE